MEIKDIAVEVKRMDEVRGGANTVVNSSTIGGLYSTNSNHARNMHGGSQSIDSTNIQSNLVEQRGSIVDLDSYTNSWSAVNSSFDFQFGGYGKGRKFAL